MRRIRPDVTVWYHQPYGFVVLPTHGRGLLERRYARLAGIRTGRLAALPGTAATWQERAVRGSQAFVVELGARIPSWAASRRHARAALAVARGV